MRFFLIFWYVSWASIGSNSKHGDDRGRRCFQKFLSTIIEKLNVSFLFGRLFHLFPNNLVFYNHFILILLTKRTIYLLLHKSTDLIVIQLLLLQKPEQTHHIIVVRTNFVIFVDWFEKWSVEILIFIFLLYFWFD